jgi:hypothetical protein
MSFRQTEPLFLFNSAIVEPVQIVAHRERRTNSDQRYRWMPKRAGELFLAVDFDVIGDDRALLVAHRIDFSDGKALVAELGKRFLHGVVEFVFEGWGLLGRRENAGVDPIGLISPFLVEKYDLPWRVGGEAHLRLVMEPSTRRGQNENQNEKDRRVVLPCAALVGPEERLR